MLYVLLFTISTLLNLVRIKKFPPWRDLYRFDSFMNITFNDGKKHEDLSKVTRLRDLLAFTEISNTKQLFFVVSDFFSAEDNSPGYIFLQLYRSFLVLDVYMSFDLHSALTIEQGRKEFANFSHLLNASHTAQNYLLELNWHF